MIFHHFWSFYLAPLSKNPGYVYEWNGYIIRLRIPPVGFMLVPQHMHPFFVVAKDRHVSDVANCSYPIFSSDFHSRRCLREILIGF
jgi:hypothetical protein